VDELVPECSATSTPDDPNTFDSEGTVTLTWNGPDRYVKLMVGPIRLGPDYPVSSPYTFKELPAAHYNYFIEYTMDGDDYCSGQVTVDKLVSCLDPVVTDPTCTGNSDGTITAAWDDGNYPYTVTLLTDGGTVVQSVVVNTGEPKSYTFPGLSAGTYSVKVEVSSDNSCTSDAILIDPEPLIADAGEDVTAIIDANGVNSCIMLMASATGGVNPLKYSWFDGTTEISTSQNVKVCPDTETTYTLTVTDANGCSATDEVTVSVKKLDDMQWQYCSPDQEMVYICHLTGNGKYQLLCVDIHAVPAHMSHGDDVYVDQCSKPGKGPKNKSAEITADEDVESKLLVYPNPFSSNATVSFTTQNEGDIMVRLLDSNGREVQLLYKGNSSAGQQHNLTISSENLVSGTYFCVLQDKLGIIQTEQLILRK
jgi:hypothetical protein